MIRKSEIVPEIVLVTCSFIQRLISIDVEGIDVAMRIDVVGYEFVGGDGKGGSDAILWVCTARAV